MFAQPETWVAVAFLILMGVKRDWSGVKVGAATTARSKADA